MFKRSHPAKRPLIVNPVESGLISMTRRKEQKELLAKAAAVYLPNIII